MRSPEIILVNLRKNSKNVDYKYEKLYRNLYNKEFYLLAYSKIYANEGNITSGTDGNKIDDYSLEKIDNLIQSIKDESYQPKPSKKEYIPKKNGKKRALDIPSFCDKLVQEVIRQILEAIYEDSFSKNSHGFRPNKSCHTALKQMKTNFTGTKWWLEGDIKDFFDNIDHKVMIQILKKRINDEKFINLIWKFLRAGYLEDFEFNKTYSGTPQGGIISPLLSNIYLNEFDRYIEFYIKDFNKGEKRKDNITYRAITSKIYKARKKLKEPTAEERLKIIKEIDNLKQELRNHRTYDQLDERYRRMKYVRYADDFIIGIIGSKENAIQIKADLTEFLKKELKLELSQEKTLITHRNNIIRFLGYGIFMDDGYLRKRQFHDRLEVARNNVDSVRLSLPFDILQSFMLKNEYIFIKQDGSWKAKHRAKFVNNDPLEIILAYNSEFRGFYNYYKLAFDAREKLVNAHYLFTISFCKTLGNKYSTKVNKLKNFETEKGNKKFFRNGRWGICWIDKKGKEKWIPLFHYSDMPLYKEIWETDKQLSKIEENIDLV